MKIARRHFLKGTLASIVGTAFLPDFVIADWSETAFGAKTSNEAIMALFNAEPENNPNIVLDVPDLAENGAVVRTAVTANVPKVESITIIVENNPLPLTGHFKLAEGAEPYISTRVKMAKTSNVIAVVKADGKLYTSRKEVKVTEGGCAS
jgi:sulfur-oxidizing protein SoxY